MIILVALILAFVLIFIGKEHIKPKFILVEVKLMDDQTLRRVNAESFYFKRFAIKKMKKLVNSKISSLDSVTGVENIYYTNMTGDGVKWKKLDIKELTYYYEIIDRESDTL